MATKWMRWNETTHIFEYSTNDGVSYIPLPLNASILNEGTVSPGVLPTTGGAHLILTDGSAGKTHLQSVANTASFLKNLSTPNAGASWVQDDPSQCGTMLHQSAAGGWYFYYSPPGGTIVNVATISTAGGLNCSAAIVGGPNGQPSIKIGGATAAFPAWRNTGAVAECVLADASNWASLKALNFSSIGSGNVLADLTITGATNFGGGISISAGNLTCAGYIQNTGVMYPGRIDATGSQGSWYLASHGSYGLYSNTGLYLGLGLTCAGVTCSAAISCTNIVPSGLIYANGIGSAAASVSITLAADGYIRRISSSERFKEDIRRGWTNPQRAALLSISPILYTAKEDTEKKFGDYLGFSAEELDAAGLRHLVNYEEDKTTPASIREHAFLASFLDLLKDHEQRIVALEGR
jgi:hypothetical protein